MKPCLFCHKTNLDVSSRIVSDMGKKRRQTAVYCKDCRAYDPRVLTDPSESGVELAIKRWNHENEVCPRCGGGDIQTYLTKRCTKCNRYFKSKDE